jgi:CheY-like chemotaxis protein/HPt (histidine-containing phosphotransfer) domain-containing protein
VTKPIRHQPLHDLVRGALGLEVRSANRAALLKGRPKGARPRGRARVLLAEDNPVNQKVATRMLDKLGHIVDVVSNGLEAVQAVRKLPYDVILMDCQMPEMDGYTATGEIRNLEGTGGHTPIIAMTANAMAGDRERCLAAGMDDYVAKPIRVEELVAALERCQRRPDAGARGAPPAEIGAAGASAPLAPGSPEGLGGMAPAGPEGAAASIDPTAIERLAATMGGAFIAELIDTFGEDARELIGTLRRTLAATDLDGFRRAAHSLKSTSETLGAAHLAAMARELETMARAGNVDRAGDRLEQLVGEYEIVARLLGECRRGLSA